MKKREDFAGEVAIVTGGAMGIGKQIVEELSEKGVAVVVCDTEVDLGKQVVETIKKKRGRGDLPFCRCH